MTPDPLADALRDSYMRDYPIGEDTIFTLMARAAREHIAAEIEMENGPPMLARDDPWCNGMMNAARIARGNQ